MNSNQDKLASIICWLEELTHKEVTTVKVMAELELTNRKK